MALPPRVTQSDVARRAGVSRALVSLVVRGAPQVRADKRAAVQAAITELGYRANTAGQLLASKSSSLVGVAARTLDNPFYGELIEHLHSALGRHGYQMIVQTAHDDADVEEAAIDALLGLGLAGLVIIAPLGADGSLTAYARSVATVLIGRDGSAIDVDSVTADDRLGGRLATQHLIGTGHRGIVFCDSDLPTPDWSSRQRQRGYAVAMRAAGLESVARVVKTSALTTVMSADPRPTAVFSHDDVAARAAQRVVAQCGLRVPEDVAIVGYNNSILASLGVPGLTSVDQPREAAAMRAVDALISRREGRTRPIHHTVRPRLVVRESG